MVLFVCRLALCTLPGALRAGGAPPPRRAAAASARATAAAADCLATAPAVSRRAPAPPQNGLYAKHVEEALAVVVEPANNAEGARGKWQNYDAGSVRLREAQTKEAIGRYLCVRAAAAFPRGGAAADKAVQEDMQKWLNGTLDLSKDEDEGKIGSSWAPVRSPSQQAAQPAAAAAAAGGRAPAGAGRGAPAGDRALPPQAGGAAAAAGAGRGRSPRPVAGGAQGAPAGAPRGAAAGERSPAPPSPGAGRGAA